MTAAERGARGEEIAVGIDLVEPERIREAATRWGEAFLDRLFTPEERAYCDAMADPWPHYAARFAAKEALGKALGTGMRGIHWRDISVAKDAAGQPTLRVAWPDGLAPRSIALSLTHARSVAGAVVIVTPGA
jgi:holo-[acyl-carrier protein] synthase